MNTDAAAQFTAQFSNAEAYDQWNGPTDNWVAENDVPHDGALWEPSVAEENVAAAAATPQAALPMNALRVPARATKNSPTELDMRGWS